MAKPKRLKAQAGRYALVDGISFRLPIDSKDTPGLMAAYTIDADRAKALLPGNELHPLRVWKRALLVIAVVDYRITDIGNYIEFSIGIPCTHGARPGPPLLPAIFRKLYGTGQYVYDLPVSTEISVKGGKGIWGMPKHQANLDFLIGPDRVSSQYDKDGQLVVKIEIERPAKEWFSVSMSGTNYCRFRGMLMKSYVYFQGKLGFAAFRSARAKLTLGSHPLAQPLKQLDISADPMFVAYFPSTRGILDDHFESWFLSSETPDLDPGEGLDSVINLGQGKDWLPPPSSKIDAGPSTFALGSTGSHSAF
jgi:Acetoacetate decarboxylase (ADC)